MSSGVSLICHGGRDLVAPGREVLSAIAVNSMCCMRDSRTGWRCRGNYAVRG